MRDLKCLLIFGVANSTAMMVLHTILRRRSSCLDLYSHRAYRSGWQTCGPRKRLCAALLVGMALFQLGAICL